MSQELGSFLKDQCPEFNSVTAGGSSHFRISHSMKLIAVH